MSRQPTEMYDLGEGRLLTRIDRPWGRWLIHPVSIDAETLSEEAVHVNDRIHVVENPAGLLFDSETRECLRVATVAETVASLGEAAYWGGVGDIFLVDGRRCFVAGGLKPRQWSDRIGDA